MQYPKSKAEKREYLLQDDGSVQYSKSKADELVSKAFEMILQREVDAQARTFYREKLMDGSIGQTQFVEILFNSIEFQMLKTDWNRTVHKSRKEFIQKIPQFNHILDIGGSSPNVEEGALIELGYSHIPKTIDVLDLPVEEQYWGKPKFPQDRDYSILNGRCTLHYEHGKAEDIASIESLMGKSYDMIFMGEVIEHIMPSKLRQVLNWIHGALSRGSNTGYFIFDTPNRIATRLINPTGYIDGDHKKEYEPDELRALLKDAHFEIVEEYGLVNLEYSISNHVFSASEAFEKRCIRVNFVAVRCKW